jgi:hypothetical protein
MNAFAHPTPFALAWTLAVATARQEAEPRPSDAAPLHAAARPREPARHGGPAPGAAARSGERRADRQHPGTLTIPRGSIPPRVARPGEAASSKSATSARLNDGPGCLRTRSPAHPKTRMRVGRDPAYSGQREELELGTLDSLLGGGQLGKVQDFLQRYEQGAPADGISDQEALDHHDQVAAAASPEEYQQAAGEAFQRMTPEDREQVGQQLQRGAQAHGVDLGGDGPAQLRDPGTLAQLAGTLQRRQPGLLEDLLGRGQGGQGGGGMLANPAVRAALGGIAAMAVKRVLQQRR